MATDKNLTNLQWEEAKKQQGGRSVTPRVSIQKSGRIAFNKQAVEDFIKDNQYAKLFYEPHKRLVGVKPVKEADENAYKIRFNKKYGSANVSAMAFLKQRDLWPESAIAFTPIWHDESQMIVIDLDAPIKGGKSGDEDGDESDDGSGDSGKGGETDNPQGGTEEGKSERRLT